MRAKRGWITLLLCLGLGALGVSALAPRWMPGGSTPAEGPAAPAEPPNLVCYGQIDLERGCTSLYPLQPGRVARIPVRENDKVPAGAPLLELEDETALARVEEARAAADAAEAQLAEARSAPKQHRLRMDQQESACEALKCKLSAARHALAHQTDLNKANLINAHDLAIAKDMVDELEALRQVEQKKLAELGLRCPEREIRRAEAEAAVFQARRKQAERSLAECILRAPRAGTVARLLVAPGAVLALPAQQPAVIFVPDEPRIVRAELEQEFAARVALGQAVWVQDDVGSERIGAGRVVRLSDWYLPRRAISLEPVRPTAGRTLEFLVALNPKHAPVRIGQRVRVTGMRPGDERETND